MCKWIVVFVNNACNDLAYNESLTVKTTETNKEYCLPTNTNKYSPYATMACYCIRLFCLTYNERKERHLEIDLKTRHWELIHTYEALSANSEFGKVPSIPSEWKWIEPKVWLGLLFGLHNKNILSTLLWKAQYGLKKYYAFFSTQMWIEIPFTLFSNLAEKGIAGGKSKFRGKYR